MLKNRLLYSLAQIQFDTLSAFSEEMEQNIESNRINYFDYLTEGSKNIETYDLDLYWEYNSDRINELSVDYPNLLRSSLLISCVSNLEKTLMNVYDDIKSEAIPNLISLNNKSLRGSTIEKVLLSIHDRIQLSNLLDSDEWNRLKLYIQIRNRVVHGNGTVHPVKYKELFDSIKMQESNENRIVGLNDYHELVFLDHFSKNMISDSRFVLRLLISTITEYFKSSPEPQ